MARCSGSTVTIQNSYSYDGYGVLLQNNSVASLDPGKVAAQQTNLLYAGEQFDTNLQMYYNRARYYDPLAGRFNRIDPFPGNNQDPQSLHKYLYCHANPVNGIDPSGEFTLLELGVVLSVIVLLVSVIVAFAKPAYYWLKTEEPTARDLIVLDQAIKGAKELVKNALTTLKEVPQEISTVYKDWWGKYDASRHRTVMQHFKNIKKYLNNGFEWRKIPNYKNLAGYYRRLDWVIFSEEFFWQEPIMPTPHSELSMAGAVIHELAHKSGVSVSHETYDAHDCAELARKYPERAVKNADNYRLFAEGFPL